MHFLLDWKMPKILSSALFKVWQISPSFTLGIIYQSTKQPYFVSSRNAPATNWPVEQANEQTRREHKRSWQKEIHFISTYIIDIILTQVLTCALPCFSCTEVAVSVISTDLLLGRSLANTKSGWEIGYVWGPI